MLAAKQASAGRGRGRQASLVEGWLAEASKIGRGDNYAGKRRHPRFKWQVPAVIEIDPDSPHRRLVYATTRDISESGIGVKCRDRLPQFTNVRVYVNDGEEYVSAVVRHSTGTLGGFIVGTEFTDTDPSNGLSLSA